MRSFDQFISSPSKSFAALCLSFCLGILLGPLVPSFLDTYFLAAALGLLALALNLPNRRPRLALLVLALFLFGVGRYLLSFPPPGPPVVASKIGQTVRIMGAVVAQPEDTIALQKVTLGQVALADAPHFGRILVRLPKYPSVAYADRLTFTCRLAQPEPFNGFAYDRYLESRGIYAICFQPENLQVAAPQAFSPLRHLLTFKHLLVSRLSAALPEPHASFVSGLIFGGSSALSKDLREDFSRTGTSHILAASGFNVSLFSVVLLSWLLGTRLGRRRGLLAAALLVFLYVLSAGATPSVVRAGIMGGAVMLGAWVRRRPYLPNIFLLALSLMLLGNPRILLDDPGFQLSFVSAFALATFVPRWEDHFSFLPETLGWRAAFVGSLAALIFTAPVIFWHFGAISLLSPLINFLILPLIPYLMALSLFIILVAFVSPLAATFVALPVWAGSSILLHLLTWFAALPFVSVAPASSKVLAVVWVAALLIIFLCLPRLSAIRRHRA